MEIEKGHGEAGKVDPQSFTNLLPLRQDSYDTTKLAYLAGAMATNRDSLSDGPDPEENLFMPAGYTYFGQFIDHDLTLDTTSTLDPEDLIDPKKPANDPTNLRSPRFDLDCIYGTGPGDRPYMYAVKDDPATEMFGGASLLIGESDLARATNGRAIIGDKRNDENSIVNQIQQTFIRFHNKVVATLALDPNLRGGELFRRARDEVRWTYQQIIVDDFLPRIIESTTLNDFKQNRTYQLYSKELRANLPREFVAAAYRFGHSAVRTGYRLNGKARQSGGTILPIFQNPPAANVDDSLVGFDPLPAAHVVDNWGRFFSSDTPRPGERLMSNAGDSLDIKADGTGGDGTVRLQYAYKLDPSITDPLKNLPVKIASKNDVLPASLRDIPPGVPGPSLALLNLLRGNRYQLQGGQKYAQHMGIKPLDPKYLCIRQSQVKPDRSKVFTITRISDIATANNQMLGSAFEEDTPLWFYILAEAQAPIVDFWEENGNHDLTEEQMEGLNADGSSITALAGPVDASFVAEERRQLAATRCAGTQLRGVGARIVAEVFYGLMDSDPDSIFGRRPAGWQPVFGAGPATIPRLLRFVDAARGPA